MKTTVGFLVLLSVSGCASIEGRISSIHDELDKIPYLVDEPEFQSKIVSCGQEVDKTNDRKCVKNMDPYPSARLRLGFPHANMQRVYDTFEVNEKAMLSSCMEKHLSKAEYSRIASSKSAAVLFCFYVSIEELARKSHAENLAYAQAAKASADWAAAGQIMQQTSNSMRLQNIENNQRQLQYQQQYQQQQLQNQQYQQQYNQTGLIPIR